MARPSKDDEALMEAAARFLVFKIGSGPMQVSPEAAYRAAIEYHGGELWPETEKQQALMRLRQKFPRRRSALEAAARKRMAGDPLAYRNMPPLGTILGTWQFRGNQADSMALAKSLREAVAEFSAATLALADLIQQSAEANNTDESNRLAQIAKRALSDMRKRRV